MHFARNRAILFLVVACVWPLRAETPFVETRSTLEKWVEARQLISKTRTDWQAAKETLQQNVQLFERELQAVQEQGSKLSTNNTQIEKERREAEVNRQAA